MDVKINEIILCFISTFFCIRVFSTNNSVFKSVDYDKYSIEHGCTPGFYGDKCYATHLKLVGEGLSFLRHINGNFASIEGLETSGNEEAFTISFSLFLPFSNLKTLRIHNCNVVDIEPGAFRSLHNLEVLEITGNSNLTFDSITKGLYQLNSPNLQVFNISGNHNAEDLPEGFIRKSMFDFLFFNTSITNLDVSWTKLTKFLAPFDLLPHLETLNISGTLLLGSPGCMSTITSLTNFSYIATDHWLFSPREYKVRWVAEPHGLFKRTTEDNCVYNKYISEKGCIIIGTSLRTLQTRYIDLDNFFLDLSKDLCIHNNNILNHIVSNSKISKQLGLISGYDELKLFDMSYPEVLFEGPLIKPTMFYAMPSLKVLRLAGFHLYRFSNEHLEKLVSQNYNLTELDISGNQLTKVPKKMFTENKYLEYLNISWNKLTVFETDLSSCVHILLVDLRHNFLKVISVYVVQHFTSLERYIEINLKDNELECNCDLLTLIDDVNVSAPHFSCRYEGANRLISKNMSHTFVQNACAKAEESNTSFANLLGAIFGVLVAVLVITAMVIIYRKRRKRAARENDQENIPVVIHLTDCEQLKEFHARNPQFVVFLAYCSKDSDFVMKKIYRKLNAKLLHLLKDTEHANDPDNLIIIYDKHFLAGIDIDEICRVAIKESHVTVAIVTENFLESSWCNLEVKMALSSKVPLLPLFVTKCEPERLTGFLRVVYEEKVRLLWPDTTLLDEMMVEAEENKLLDTLCTHIITYVRLHQDQACNV